MSTAQPGPQLAVAAVAVRGAKVLLVRRGQAPALGRWSFPGGHVEPGEHLGSAVRRELDEETGLQGTVVRLLDVVERIGREGHYVILDYEVEIADQAEPIPGSDAAEARWVPFGNLSELDLTRGLVEFLQRHGLHPG